MIKVLAYSPVPATKSPGNFSSDRPDHILALKKCTQLVHFKQVHAQILKDPLPKINTQLSKLVDSLVVSSCIDYARQVFDRISEPSTFAFNLMVKGYATHGLGYKGIELYVHMRCLGIEPDNFTYPFLLKACSDLNQVKEVHAAVVKNRSLQSEIHSLTSLIAIYCAFRDIKSARLLFDRISERNVVTWTSMIAGYVKQKRYRDGIELFCQMRESGSEINELTLVSVLSACANLGGLEMGKWVHEFIDKEKIVLNPKLAAAVIDMYAKCGCIEKASQVFEEATKKSVYVWNSMIGGLATHGYGTEAVEMFQQMRMNGVKPDGITLIGVLTACSHSGMVEKGKEIFYSMQRDCEIEPNIKHYGCLVDLLCRADRLAEAYEVIMDIPMEPNGAIWEAC